MSSQNSLKARSHRDKTSSLSVMVSRKYSPRTNLTKRLSFLSLVTEATEEVKDPRISSEKVSENSLFNPKNWREISEDQPLCERLMKTISRKY